MHRVGDVVDDHSGVSGAFRTPLQLESIGSQRTREAPSGYRLIDIRVIGSRPIREYAPDIGVIDAGNIRDRCVGKGWNDIGGLDIITVKVRAVGYDGPACKPKALVRAISPPRVCEIVAGVVIGNNLTGSSGREYETGNGSRSEQ